MRSLLFAAALAAAAVLSGCAKHDATSKADDPAAAEQRAEAALPTMTVAEVADALAKHEIQAVDCNGPGTRKRKGILPGAILISDEETFAASELPADKDARLIFYCGGPG